MTAQSAPPVPDSSNESHETSQWRASTVSSFEGNKMVLIQATSDRVPKIGRGGPGAVVTNLSKGFQSIDSDWEQHILAVRGEDKVGKMTGSEKLLGSIYGLLRRSVFLSNMVLLLELWVSLFLYTGLVKRSSHLQEADVVHCHDIYAFYCIRKFLKERSARLPVFLLSIHSSGSSIRDRFRRCDFEVYNFIEDQYREIEYYSLSLSDYIVFGSRAAFNYLLEDYPDIMKGKKYDILYNGIDDTSCMRRRDNEDGLVCIAVGSLNDIKRMDVLVDTFRYIEDERITLRIVGDGPNRLMLQGMINILGLQERVKLLGYREDVSELLARSDLYLSSSSVAMFDLSILEAMRAGLPIIASKRGGNIEAVGDCGLLVEPDPKVFAEAIQHLYGDPELRDRLGAGAYNRFRGEFTITTMSRNAANLYARVLEEMR